MQSICLTSYVCMLSIFKSYNLNINFAGDAPRHNLTFDSSYDDPVGMKCLFYQEMVKQKILFPNVIYIQFSHSLKDIQRTIKAADKSFKFVRDNLSNIDSALEGAKSVEVFRKNS